MATEFDTLFKEHAFPHLLALRGESVIYRPLNGVPRSIQAIVNREPNQSLNEVNRGTVPTITVRVYNDSVTGISSRDLDRGGDLLEVSVIKGQPAQNRPIFDILGPQTGGVLKLEVH